MISNEDNKSHVLLTSTPVTMRIDAPDGKDGYWVHFLFLMNGIGNRTSAGVGAKFKTGGRMYEVMAVNEDGTSGAAKRLGE